MLKGEPKATQQAVTAEIFASAKASGVEPAELVRLFNSEPLMRNAVFQRMMYDAGKYRLVMKARDAAAARPVPPVQRPGMARTPAEREHADLRRSMPGSRARATSRTRWRCTTPENPASVEELATALHKEGNADGRRRP